MTGHIFLEGEIGTEVTAKTVRADISQYPQAKDFIIHVNSGGGDVYEGELIGHIIKNIGKPTVAHIGALCASIATYAALCCDRVIMGPHGDFMIHLPTGTLNGTAEDLRRGAAQLDRIKAELIERYMPRVAKKGVTKEQVSAMIDKETSMSPAEALALGFVDDVQEKMKAVAKLDIKKFNMEENKETKTMFESFAKRISNAFKIMRFKNVINTTLADGTGIIVMSEDNTWDGKAVTYEDGSPLAADEYTTSDGIVFIVDDNSTITTATMPTMDNSENVDALKKEIETLKAQLAAKENDAKTQVASVIADNEIELGKFKNEVLQMKAEFEKLKNMTIGDNTKPDKGTKDNPKAEEKSYEKDPMAILGMHFVNNHRFNN